MWKRQEYRVIESRLWATFTRVDTENSVSTVTPLIEAVSDLLSGTINWEVEPYNQTSGILYTFYHQGKRNMLSLQANILTNKENF